MAIKYPEVNDMPCIYADIPNGLNGDFYDLSIYSKIIKKLEQPTAYDIDAIKNKIEHEADYYDAEVNKDIAKGLYIALKIIKTFDILKK